MTEVSLVPFQPVTGVGVHGVCQGRVGDRRNTRSDDEDVLLSSARPVHRPTRRPDVGRDVVTTHRTPTSQPPSLPVLDPITTYHCGSPTDTTPLGRDVRQD